jgi:hypothetical protein
MTKVISFRTCSGVAGVAGLLSLSFMVGNLAPSLNAAFGASATVSSKSPMVAVNHYRKGNRQPVLNSTARRNLSAPELGRGFRGLGRLEATDKLPLGCDAVLSPVAAPSRVVVYGRCMV